MIRVVTTQRRLAAAVYVFSAGLAVSASAATITVTGTGDTVAVDGAVTLREAITSINNGANVNTDVVAAGAYGVNDAIAFAIGSGVQTITVTTPLPQIKKPILIDGTTQAGFLGSPIIEIVGDPTVGSGLDLMGGNSVIRGLALGGFSGGAGILLEAPFMDPEGGGQNLIAGNYIGLDSTGSIARSNCAGISIQTDSNLIGGTASADRNVISGNSICGNPGIAFGSIRTGNIVEGNYIGTNPSGTIAIPNGYGMASFATQNATISGNLISGNSGGGINFNDVQGVEIIGNRIGTTITGSPLGNGAYGVRLSQGTTGSTIGGTGPGTGNVIEFNTVGVLVEFSPGNAVLGNSIVQNVGVGIQIASGPNPTPPVITAASVGGGDVSISGTLNSTSNTTFRVEFFSNQICDAAPPNNYGEGQTFLGFAVVTTGGGGNASFGPVLFPVTDGQSVLTATATDPVNGTSMFSQCFSTAPPTPTPTPTPTATPTPTPTPTPSPTPAPTRRRRPHTRVVPFRPVPTPTATPTPTPSASLSAGLTQSSSDPSRPSIRYLPVRTPTPAPSD